MIYSFRQRHSHARRLFSMTIMLLLHVCFEGLELVFESVARNGRLPVSLAAVAYLLHLLLTSLLIEGIPVQTRLQLTCELEAGIVTFAHSGVGQQMLWITSSRRSRTRTRTPQICTQSADYQPPPPVTVTSSDAHCIALHSQKPEDLSPTFPLFSSGGRRKRHPTEQSMSSEWDA